MAHVLNEKDIAFENLSRVGDIVALFMCKLYNRLTTNFNADAKYLKSPFLFEIFIQNCFGIENHRLDTKGFEFNTKDIAAKRFGEELKKRHYNCKTFNVEKMRIFLNEKYQKEEKCIYKEICNNCNIEYTWQNSDVLYDCLGFVIVKCPNCNKEDAITHATRYYRYEFKNMKK